MSTNAESSFGIISSGNGEAVTTSTSAIVAAEAVTGSHVLHIRGYSMTKGIGNGEYIKSSTFSVGGQRWYIRYYPDGNDPANADWIAMFLQHDRHPDADVQVKARYRFSVLDVNTGEPVPNFSLETYVDDTFNSKNPSWGFKKFVIRRALEKSSYLIDDCFSLRCDITVSKSISTQATMQFVVVPPSNMHRHFRCLLSDAAGTDVTFDVAGEMFAAHRCVLAARSSVFMAELFGFMKEKAMDCIRIHDMEPRVFKAMLHFIYTDTVPDIDKDDVFVITQHLLVAADIYDLQRLKLICEDRLCRCMDTSNVAMTLVLAERHGCHGLKNACFEMLKSSKHLKMAMETEGFDHIMSSCPYLIRELLAKVATCP